MSDRFEGLGLPQLVERLHDIALPPAIALIPATAGWQILGAWALAVGGVLGVHALLRWRRNRYRREAVQSLRSIEGRLSAEPEAIAEIGALLKRTAMTAYSRERVASLHGGAWAEFLTQTSREDAVVTAAAAQLAAVAYRPPKEAAIVLEAARRWIRCHRD